MKIMKCNDPALLDTAVSILEEGNTVIAPCDTIYGFLGIVPDSDSVIRGVKGRAETKPFLQIIRKEWLSRLSTTVVDPRILSYWPGPLTLIVDHVSGGTAAYRAPDDNFLSELLDRIGNPLYSTSVNRAGEPPLNDIDSIISVFGTQVPLIIDGGDLGEAAASTILDVTSDPPRILRQGACQVILRDSR